METELTVAVLAQMPLNQATKLKDKSQVDSWHSDIKTQTTANLESSECDKMI